MTVTRRFLAVIAFLAGGMFSLPAQNMPEENVFHLVQAEKAQQVTEGRMNYRRVTGNARFLHNDTYLVCDSASWNVDGRYIEAFGNVQILQNNTMLRSEQMLYIIDQNTAKFSGEVVELFDKDGNTLRTSQLDYNTKDSVAVFRLGGAMRDTSDNIIESYRGTYDAKERSFLFEDRVQLYMDSILVKSNSIQYMTDYSKAFFGKMTYMWRGNGFIRSDSGWYDRNSAVIYFADKVYMNDPQYEAWTDEVYYDQNTGVVDMYHNTQILDTTHKSIYFAHRLKYEPSNEGIDSLPWVDRVTLTVDPAIVYCGENENHQPDTLYAAADSISIYGMYKCDIEQQEFDDAAKRIEDLEFDALAKSRAEQAAARAEERKRKMQEMGLMPPDSVLAKMAELERIKDSIAVSDSLALATDSLGVSVDSLDLASALPPADSLGVPLDSLAVPLDSLVAQTDSLVLSDEVPFRDSTLIRYLNAYYNAKAFRKDVQAMCDSMFFTEIDSIARMFGKPVLWDEIKNQMTADEMQIMMKNGNLYRGSMITNAWVISQEDSIHFHQIKSTEMLGYFYDNKIYRYDALGGVNAVFYLAEDGEVTTVNIKESKSLTAMIKDGTAKRMLYVESIKSDAYPVLDIDIEKQRLKGFDWRGDIRPAKPEDVTTRKMNQSDRGTYKHVPRPNFPETNKYFDNYMQELLSGKKEEKGTE